MRTPSKITQLRKPSATEEPESRRSRSVADSWRRYFSVMERWDPEARSVQDLFVDRLITRSPEGRWLDAGCGRATFPTWRSHDQLLLAASGSRLFGCDQDFLALRDRRDGIPLCNAHLEALPYRDEAFSLVVANMVFEHIDHPIPTVAELVRVTRKGGHILVHTVNALHYLALLARFTPFRFHRWIVARVEGRAVGQVYPTRYRANTERRLCSLFAQAGCKRIWGGAMVDMPLHLPYPAVFWLAISWGLVERRLAQAPGLRHLLRPNLLIEFERNR